MSVKLPKRLSSKRRKPPKDNAQAELIHNLGLDAFWNAPLDPASMLDISTWNLENQAPLDSKDLPSAFLRRLWLLSQDARSPCCKPSSDALTSLDTSPEMLNVGESQCAINPLDLVSAVFMSANPFLQQEITVHMVQCQFAVPLVLPSVDPEEASRFLLWPLRGVVSQLLEKNGKLKEGNLASTYMPIVSCVKLGHCNVSKSKVLNHILSGPKSCNDTFLHRGMDGGQLPRTLSNGLVEIGWHLPTGDTARDGFPVPVAVSNLRGDASKHEGCLNLLCQASSVMIVFCGTLKEKDKQLLASCRDMASKLILIDISDTEKNEHSVVGFVGINLEQDMGLPEGSVLQGDGLSEEELADRINDILKDLLPDKLKLVTLEAAADLALELGLNVDEGTVCKKAMAKVEKVLEGLDEGSAQFREKQLPLQGPWWSKLAEIEKMESKQRKEEIQNYPQLQKEKRDILAELKNYKITPAMKTFTDALFTIDKVERTYFLKWMKLRLQSKQTEKQNIQQDLKTDKNNGMLEYSDYLTHGADGYLEDSDTFCSDSTFEEDTWCLQTFEPDPLSLGLEHFLREMGLIFELTHISHRSRNQKVLRLPSLAVDLLFYGVPLELMDGDASNIPTRWLGSIFAELKRRLPQEQCKTRVLTNLGVHHAKNAEVLSSLFGVKFPEGGKRSTRGVYMGALRLPDGLRMDMECDFLLLIDVEGLCPASQDNKTKIHDHEMATVAAGLSNVLIQNIASDASSELETDIAFIVNALLRVKACDSMPNCQLLVQDEGINTLLQASQLKRVSEMLQTEIGNRGTNNDEQPNTKTISCITCVKGPWSNVSLSEPVETQYSEAVLTLKKNLFGALKKSTATSLSEFMIHLSAIWDAVKEESFSIGLQNTEIALAFSVLCTEFSQWKTSFLEHMENWIMGAGKKIFATKEKALDAEIQNDLLNELKDEGREEVKTEVDKLRSQVEAYLMKDDVLKERTETFKPILMSNMSDLQERVTEEITQRLARVGESHCSSIQVKKFETVLEKEQESKLRALVENSLSTKLLLQDEQLEEEFEGVWSNMLSSFDFRPSETDDITARVTEVLRLNLISRGLLKHILKIEVIGQNETSSFQVYDEHFGYRSRLKHMFEDNNRLQRVEAQQVACSVIEEYKQFVAEKSVLPADFSDNYIKEMLGSVEKALKEKCMAIKSAFEVDLKVYLCSLACQDFQKVHDRFAKDTELLTFITATKSSYLAKFIYRFRKRDQCQRVAQAFTSMIIKPTVLDYIYRPLGLRIVEEIQAKEQQYQSSCAFSQHLLEQLIHEDRFESFLEYLLSYDSFRLSKIQETVVAHLSESPNLDKWRQQRLGEIVGKVAAAVSETAEGTNGILSDTKPLLERVCLILESDGNVQVTRVSLDGPLFSITTEWDRFVTCLMELLAAMRLELAQEFSQTRDVTELLHCLPIQPHYSLLDRVRGCEKQCPLCRAPCEVQEKGHEVHSALLHRPKDLLPYDLSSVSCRPESMILSNPGQNEDTCKNLLSRCPDWNIYSEDPDSQMPTAYWRYVLVRYNDKFAKEYEREPTNILEEWKQITEEEALLSLREAFLTEKY
ncbi:interferon-induced very large GTPase 1 [Limanda limanda]|uniref:interferon-induced very large GTPase 1 n=1 Tax=Limanda limanda TaxID=27771 RepID=UPI0029C78FCC|nr:interferon-induced very large GTPase 1 [Limanda limanda]